MEKIFDFFFPGNNSFSGTGRRLNEDLNDTEKSPLSKEEQKRKVAQAALARINTRTERPGTKNTALRVQVRKELEKEKEASTSSCKSSKLSSCLPNEIQLQREMKLLREEDEIRPKDMDSTTKILFKCPTISDEVLTREEWNLKIKSYLYDKIMKEEDTLSTAILIIRSCNSDEKKIENCVEILSKYLQNIVFHPDESKYHNIRMGNKVFQEKVKPIEGALEFLCAAGFVQETWQTTNENEDYLIFHKENCSEEYLLSILDRLKTPTEPIGLQLDRNLQVIMNSEGISNIELPSSFYSLTAREMLVEYQSSTIEAEKARQLIPKSLIEKQKQQKHHSKNYKYAIIRIRFPDGVHLQGTFSVNEKFKDIYKFVQENLFFDLPFSLKTPTGLTLDEDVHADMTLIGLELVPATVLNFVWHSVIQEDMNDIPDQVYLKSDILKTIHN